MPKTQALDAEEELLWRSLMRLVITLPRTLSDALERTADMNATEYQVLMYLSEAPRSSVTDV